MIKDDEGLTIGMITISLFRAYCNSLERDLAWEDLDEEQQEGWIRAAETGNEILEDAENLPWTSLAEAMFSRWAQAVDYPVRDFNSIDTVTRSAWVVVAKHLANLCSLESPEGIGDHERRWSGAAKRLAKPTE
jgi:hypothetical protein